MKKKKKNNIEIINEAEKELKKFKNSKLVIKLTAIIALQKYPIKQISEIFGVTKVSIYRWEKKFIKGGIDLLKDKPKGHLKSKLSEKQIKKIFKWIEKSKKKETLCPETLCLNEKLTLKKVKIQIKNEFKINLSITPIWKLLKKHNISLRHNA